MGLVRRDRRSSLPVEWAIDARIDPGWESLDALDHPGDFHLPIPLFHARHVRVAAPQAAPGWGEPSGGAGPIVRHGWPSKVSIRTGSP